MVGRRRSSSLVALVVGAVLLFAPATASATTTCDYSSTGKLMEILLPATGDAGTISVLGSGEIAMVSNTGAQVFCTSGTPTVTNTNVITVVGSATNNEFTLGFPSTFAPGATA